MASAGAGPSGSGPLAVRPSLSGGPSGGAFSSPAAPPTLGGRHVVASFLTPPPAEGSAPVTSCRAAPSAGVSPPSAAPLAFLRLAFGLLPTPAVAARGPKPPSASASLQPPAFAASPPVPVGALGASSASAVAPRGLVSGSAVTLVDSGEGAPSSALPGPAAGGFASVDLIASLHDLRGEVVAPPSSADARMSSSSVSALPLASSPGLPPPAPSVSVAAAGHIALSSSPPSGAGRLPAPSAAASGAPPSLAGPLPVLPVAGGRAGLASSSGALNLFWGFDRGPQEQRLVLSHKHPRFCTCNQQEAAQSMMDGIGHDGLVVDGRKLFFEYSMWPAHLQMVGIY